MGFMLLTMNAQEECKVLMKTISSKYSGGCKNGLANGSGEAWGEQDHYIGKFKKGLPDGKGTYYYSDQAVYVGIWFQGMRHGEGTFTFKLNCRDTIQTGLWEKDVFTGKPANYQPYKIIEERSIDRVRVYRQSNTGDEVHFFLRTVSGDPGVSNIQTIGTSGIEASWSDQPGFRACEFPFNAKIRFQMWNKLRTQRYEVYVEVEISEPGIWYIELSL